MAQRRGGYQGSFNRCERPGCGCIAAKWSVYSDRMLCNSCLSFERAAYDAQQAQAQRDAAELEGILQAEYRDAYETRRDLCAGSVQ